nr:multiprotein-bridging factor 1c [Tanacetum cinerariifolium]
MGAMSQDWEPVVLHKSKPKLSKTLRERKSINQALLAEAQVKTIKKHNGGTNKKGIGIAVYARKLDEAEKPAMIERVGAEVRQMIQKAKIEKKTSEAELAKMINERLQVVHEYKDGKAVPNQGVLAKMEWVLGVKLRGKIHKCLAMDVFACFMVMVAPVISISSDVSVESVGSSFPRVILIGSIYVEVLVAPEVGAATVASPAGVLELDTHSSSEADPSESSLPPVSLAPMVSPFLCSDYSESDTKIPERHVSPTTHGAMLTRWKSRVASRSSSPTTSTPEILTAPILPAPSAIVASSSEI